jgi:hypothetical protein
MDDLAKMILAKRENAFGGFLNYMENKYAGKENGEGEEWEDDGDDGGEVDDEHVN